MVMHANHSLLALQKHRTGSELDDEHARSLFEIVYVAAQAAVSRTGVSIAVGVLIVCVGPGPLIDTAAAVVVLDGK